jgi:hypothetical protein
MNSDDDQGFYLGRFFCIGQFVLYRKKALRAECAPRGYEVCCYATPLGRERVASDSFLLHLFV